MSGLVVRRAEPADHPAVARLTVAAYEADGQLKGEHGYGTVLADVAGRAETGEVLIAVDEATGEVLGAVTFVLAGTPYAELSGPGEAEFRMLAVDPAVQGRGTGEALVRACVERAAELGCSAVVICVRAGMAAAAHRLYARLGFVRVPEKDWSPLPGVELLGLRLDLTGRS
ncbi:GNAT family N-acetyltransferase [Micromonospora sp. NPDC006766]|uniref:GNAT family N-acetyltransferase n=1 Tax=Micromonospora sp. NPDC006766 TaxID=3154778 RepID=UPI0033CE6FA3